MRNEIHMEYISSQPVWTPEVFILKHNHACYELVYYESGFGETTFDNSTIYKYQPYTYTIIPPYTYHTESHYVDTQVFCIGFHLDANYSLIPHAGLYQDTDQKILSLIKESLEELCLKPAFYNQLITSYLDQILILHHRNLGIANLDTKDEGLGNIIKYLDENFSQNISIAVIAQMAGYSYDYFRHIFKEATGTSPKNYILQKRISYAKRLLVNDTLSVTEISYLCGFSSISEFNAIFKKRVGISPLKYKQNCKHILAGVDTLHLE